MVDATLAALADLADGDRDGRAPGLRHPLDPDRDGRQRAVRTAARTSRSTTASPTRSSSGSRPRPGTATRATWSYCSRSGPPHVPWLEPDVNDHLETLAARGRPGRRGGADRVRLRPHGGRLRPRHRGRGDRREARARRSSGPPPPASTRASWPMVRDLLLERAAVERGEERASGPPTGSLPACWDVCPVGCCPNPAGRAPALAGRGLADGRRWTQRAARARRSDAAREAAELVAPSAAPRGVDRRRDQVQRRRRGHRGRPGQRGADPRAAARPRAPTTAFVGEEGASDDRAPPASAGSSTRSTAPSTSSTASRSTPCPSRPQSSTASPVGGRRGARRGPRDGVHRDPRAAARSATASASRSGRRRRWRSGWWSPASTTTRTSARIQAGGRPAAAAAGPRHPPAGLVRPRPVPRGRGPGGRATSRRASTAGTTPPVAWWPPRPAPSSSSRPGSGARTLLVCAPAARLRPSSGRWWPSAASSRTVRGIVDPRRPLGATRRVGMRVRNPRLRWCTICRRTTRFLDGNDVTRC